MLNAQQAPQYSHYVFNQFQLNPAVAGTKQCLDLRFGFRNQWTGFEDGPKTQFGSMNTRLGRSKKKGSPWHAIGIKFETDQAARFSQSLVQAAYAYHFKMGREMNASFGIFLGFNQYKVDLEGITQVGPNPSIQDPVLLDASQKSFLFPEVSPGFWMHNKKFYLGLSVKHATGNPILNDNEASEARLIQHLNFTTGYAYIIGQKTNFIPSLRVGYASGVPLGIDVNGMLDYDRRLALGLGYRNGDALIGLMKVNFLNYFTLGYAYDFTLSDAKALSGSTHEVILGISVCPGQTSGRYNPCAAYD